MKNFILCFALCLLAITNPAFAGPEEGELFGYKLGDVYSITDETRGWWFLTKWVIAENPVLPDKIKKVEMPVTPVTNKIGGVHGKTEFETYEAAKEHAEYYASVFEAKYGGDINFSGYMDENLENYMPDYEFYKVIFDRKYELTINVFEPDKDRKAYASIILTYAPTAPEYENWKNLVDEEFDKLSIDAAHSEGALRGIE